MKGLSQKGVDYDRLSHAMLKSVRIVMAIAAYFDNKI